VCLWPRQALEASCLQMFGMILSMVLSVFSSPFPETVVMSARNLLKDISLWSNFDSGVV